MTKLKPDESRSGTVDITNTGDIDGVFSIARTITADTTGALTPPNPFAAHLNLEIEDVTAAYDSLLSAMNGVASANTILPGVTHRYKFTVTFIDGGPNGADNAFKSASVTTRFNWEAVNN